MDNQHADKITQSVQCILAALPAHVTLVAAAKGRTPEEVQVAIQAGITHIGHNYVQEAEAMIPALRAQAAWHFIGHLQRNKAGKAIELFDIIETIDSLKLAQAIDQRCAVTGKLMPVLIEVNSGREPNKSGVLPEQVDELAQQLSQLAHIQVQGLMTMGPLFDNPEDIRPYFRETRVAFERLTSLPGVTLRYLSMGMSDSYQQAIAEGANMVRIGTRIFGPRA
jgi:hypothetical protein